MQRRVKGERAMMRSDHRMDGMSEFVCQSRHVTRATGKVHQYERRIFRVDRSAERATLLTLAHFAIETVLIEHAFRQLAKLWVKRIERFEYHVGGSIKLK